MQRLVEGCARLQIPAPDPAQLWRETLDVSRDLAQSVVRITITRGPGERGYAPPLLPQPTRVVAAFAPPSVAAAVYRSEEHTSELQSLMRISYAVFCLKK